MADRANLENWVEGRMRAAAQGLRRDFVADGVPQEELLPDEEIEINPIDGGVEVIMLPIVNKSAKKKKVILDNSDPHTHTTKSVGKD